MTLKNFLSESLKVYYAWFEAVDSYCVLERLQLAGEFQLGKRGLCPNLRGTLNQIVHSENVDVNRSGSSILNKILKCTEFIWRQSVGLCTCLMVSTPMLIYLKKVESV